MSKTYLFEDLFHEEGDDIVLTLPEEYSDMFSEGESVDVSIVDGSLVISRIVDDE